MMWFVMPTGGIRNTWFLGLQKFESKNGEDFLKRSKSKTSLTFAKSKTGLKETISIVGQEQELDKI
jgi:hypothetical protein